MVMHLALFLIVGASGATQRRLDTAVPAWQTAHSKPKKAAHVVQHRGREGGPSPYHHHRKPKWPRGLQVERGGGGQGERER